MAGFDKKCFAIFNIMWSSQLKGDKDMSEIAKIPSQKPESYKPSEKPEIVNLAEQKTSKVITTENGKYIDNVPQIKWGEWHECTYSGCMMLLLNALGARTTYEQVMGLTGSCYRASMAYGWDPGSSIVNITYFHLGINADQNANRLYGFDSFSIDDGVTRDEQVRNSIDSGIPVLILGGRCAPEWSIVLGYELTDGGTKYFGRSYFDNNAPDDEIYTENRYVLTNGYPGDWHKLFNKTCEPTPALDALKLSLETCLKMFTPHDNFGYGAYDMMIKGFENNEFGHVCNIVGNLIDARRAAYVYLNVNARLLTGTNKSNLLAVSSLYNDIFNMLQDVLPYEKLHHGFDESTISAEIRKELIEALRKSAILERQLRDIVTDILTNWRNK